MTDEKKCCGTCGWLGDLPRREHCLWAIESCKAGRVPAWLAAMCDHLFWIIGAPDTEGADCPAWKAKV